jgi:hypothetical protein
MDRVLVQGNRHASFLSVAAAEERPELIASSLDSLACDKTIILVYELSVDSEKRIRSLATDELALRVRSG